MRAVHPRSHYRQRHRAAATPTAQQHLAVKASERASSCGSILKLTRSEIPNLTCSSETTFRSLVAASSDSRTHNGTARHFSCPFSTTAASCASSAGWGAGATCGTSSRSTSISMIAILYAVTGVPIQNVSKVWRFSARSTTQRARCSRGAARSYGSRGCPCPAARAMPRTAFNGCVDNSTPQHLR